MVRYIDILTVADGTNGPVGMPLLCVEHEDSKRALPPGATRVTTDEYRAQEPRWRAEWETWAKDRRPPPEPMLPDALPAWACKAALDEAGMLGSLKAALADAELATRWRFESATTWHRADIEAIGDRFGVRAAERERLWARAAEIAQV